MVAGGVIGGAFTGAVSSVVSQGVGIAIGAQSSINWKSVGLSALAGGIGGGLGASNTFSGLGKLGSAVARAAVGNAATQGIATATGLQGKFDWTGVATAAVSAGASFGAAQGLGALNINGGIAYHLGTSMAGNLANAATRSVLTGSNFGDNIIAAIPDTIAQTIGGVIGDGVEKAAAERSKKDLEERLKSEAGRVLSTLQAGVYNPGNLYAFAVIPRMPNEPLVMTDVLPRSMYKTGKTMTVKGSDGKNHTLGIEIPQNKKDIDLLSREAKKVRDPKVRAFIESQLGKWEAEIKSSEGRLSDTEVEDRLDSKYWKRKPQVRTKKPSNQSPAVQEKAELRTNEEHQMQALNADSLKANVPDYGSNHVARSYDPGPFGINSLLDDWRANRIDRSIDAKNRINAAQKKIDSADISTFSGARDYILSPFELADAGLRSAFSGVFGTADAIGALNDSIDGVRATPTSREETENLYFLGSLATGVRGIANAAERTVGGAANRTSFEAYKDGLIAAMERPVVTDRRLSSLLDDLYRPNATVGNGSTAAAVRQELATGTSVQGKFHSQKATDSIRALEKWLDRNPTARLGDRAAAENVIRDMRNAQGGN